jgi:peptide subunit release factor 1 (eRF1)
MESTRKGLRSGDLDKDTYGRLNCTECDVHLDTKNDPDEVGRVRVCPECGQEWKEVG